jgi:hypothetical protein
MVHASIYIVHLLESMTFGREKHFHVDRTLEHFSSHNIIPK